MTTNGTTVSSEPEKTENYNRPTTIQTAPYGQQTEHRCIHCGKVFNRDSQIKPHLNACPERNLNRFFRAGDRYLITVVCNPKKRKIMALDSLLRKFPSDIKVFLSVLNYLKLSGEVKEFFLLDCSASPEFVKLECGKIARQTLWKTLNKPDMASLRKQVDILS